MVKTLSKNVNFASKARDHNHCEIFNEEITHKVGGHGEQSVIAALVGMGLGF